MDIVYPNIKSTLVPRRTKPERDYKQLVKDPFYMRKVWKARIENAERIMSAEMDLTRIPFMKRRLEWAKDRLRGWEEKCGKA